MTLRRRVVCGQHEVNRVAAQVLAVDAGGSRVRLVLPLVGQDEIDVPEGERGQRLLRLGFDELAAEVRCISGECLHRRYREAERHRLEGGDSSPPGDPARGCGQLGLRQFGPLEQRVGMTHQHDRGVGQPHASAGRLEQRQPRLAFEHRELLGNGRRREPQGLGHRGDRAARVQLVQEA